MTSPPPRGRAALHLNWVAIILAVVSIVQGLALNSLAGYLQNMRTPLQWFAFVLGFLIILRVFQTYVAAGLDYTEWEVSFTDIFLIFALGLIQYQIISGLKEDPFTAVPSELWVLVVGGGAVLGHLSALFRLGTTALGDRLLAERWLQIVNTAGGLVVVACAIPFLAAHPSGPTKLWLVGAQIISIAFNTWFSLHRTTSAASRRVKESGAASVPRIQEDNDLDGGPQPTVEAPRAARRIETAPAPKAGVPGIVLVLFVVASAVAWISLDVARRRSKK